MQKRDGSWIDALVTGDAEALWTKLLNLISRHSAIKNLYSHNRFPYDRLRDVYSDLTQDLFLRLYEKDRFQFYLDAGYTDENIEHELSRIEVPNLVARLLRERYPESYRLARRTSILLQTRPEFHYYPQPYRSSDGITKSFKSGRASHKLVAQVYGLSTWGLDKPMRCERQLSESTKDVAFRMRNTRRTGRGSGSQLIISSEELCQLMIDIFTAIDSPADVRTMRSLVLSKLAIENYHFMSIEAGTLRESISEADLLQVDFADGRPTPEQILLEKETTWRADAMSEELLERIRKAVRNKPQRYYKLVSVVWHCYFDSTRPSQTSVARSMGISDSLVSHYRKTFDVLIQSLDLSRDEFRSLNNALSDRLNATVTKMRVDYGADNNGNIPEHHQPYTVSQKHLSVAASAASRG